MSEPNTKENVFDVFLCHHSIDKPAIRDIAQKLKKQGIRPWLDEEQIPPGTSWQKAIGEQIHSIRSAAVIVGENGLGPWQDQEIQALLSQFVKRNCPVIPVVLPSAKETPNLPWTLENLHWVDFRVEYPDPFNQLIYGITGHKPGEQQIDSLPLVSGIPKRMYPAIVSPPKGEQRDQLLVLLDRVKEYWIDGVLKHSLFNEVLISLGKHIMDRAVEPPWKYSAKFSNQRNQPHPKERNINSTFDATSLLLILGEPGSGKTTTLLDLASDLIERARTDPKERVPVFLNLSSWEKKLTLDAWIVKELSAKYRIPVKIGHSWLKNDYLLPLLDGLDEVNISLQPACVAAINEFIEKFEFIDKIGPSGIVVCCRLEEYQWLPQRLKLNGAICLELLDSEGVNEFLNRGGPQLDTLRRAMSADCALQELSQTPLMLSIMCLAYEGVGGDNLAKQEIVSTEERREHIFKLYVDRMFQRKEPATNLLSKDKMIGWLACLAKGMKKHSQTIFLLEGLQPSWLTTRGQKLSYGTITALIIAFLFGLNEGLIVGLNSRMIFGLGLALVFGLFIFLGVGLGCWFESRLRCGFISALISSLISGLLFTWIWLSAGAIAEANYSVGLGIGGLSDRQSAELIGGLNSGLKVGLIFGLPFGLLVGLIGAVGVGSLKMIITVETMHWQWKQFKRKAIQGFIIMLIVGLFLGLLLGLFYKTIHGQYDVLIFGLSGGLVFGVFGVIGGGLVGGFTDTVRVDKALPNQGINLSLKNAVLSILIAGLIIALIFASIAGLISELRSGLISGLISWLFIGLIIGLNRGGSALVKHYSLRFILLLKGYTPFRFIEFLDHCAKLILLKKVGGGYMFIHRMLLEHFAKMEIKSTRTRFGKEEATR